MNPAVGWSVGRLVCLPHLLKTAESYTSMLVSQYLFLYAFFEYVQNLRKYSAETRKSLRARSPHVI